MVFSVVRSSQTSEPRSAVRGLGLAKRFRGAAQPPAPPTHGLATHTRTHTTGSRREVWKFGTSSLLCQNGQILRFSRFTNKQSRAHKQRRRSVARRIVWGADWAPVPTAARSSCSSSACCSLQLHLLFGQGVSGAVRVGGGGRQEVLAAVGTQSVATPRQQNERNQNSSSTSAAHSKLSISACIFPAPKHKCVEGL
jgi:hypothetical protein